MIRPATIALLTLLASSATAQTYIPSEAEKVDALKRAYIANGNSMVGWGTFDASAPRIVKTDRIAPVVKAEDKTELDEAADLNMNDLRKFSRRANAKTDVCARYHMKKVVKGDSWKCRK